MVDQAGQGARDQDTMQIVYDQAQRALDHQSDSLDELRARTSFILGAAGVIAGIIGARVGSGKVDAWSGVALGLLAVSSIACVAILSPRRRSMIFTVSADSLLTHHVEVPRRNDPVKLMRFLAGWFQTYYNDNDKLIEVYFGRLQWACAFLVAGILVWILGLLV